MEIGLNYYVHHLGDWAAATAHLSWDEDMAYTRLLRAYYHHESAIKDGQQYRLARASTPEQRAAVDSVISEFFTLVDGNHHQKRADYEIERFRASEPAREEKRANERERQRRARDRRREQFETLRTHGVVPTFNASEEYVAVESSRVTHADVTRDAHVVVTRDDTATHYPLASNQEPLANKEKETRRASAPTPPVDVEAQTWTDWIALRKAKRAPVTSTVLDSARNEAAKAGMSLDAFLRAWVFRGSQGLQADWLKPHEKGQPAVSAREQAARERFDRMTGGILNSKGDANDIIDITSNLPALG